MQSRSYDDISVCLSVYPSLCPSVCQTRSLWQNGRKICSDFYTMQKIIYPSFQRRKMVDGGRPLLPYVIGQPTPRWSEIADFEPIIARSSSAVTPSEISSIITNRKSTTRLPMSLRWSSYVAPKFPKGGSKTQNGRFFSKIALLLKKVCYEVSLCENYQRQSCRTFIGLTIRAKMIGGDVPF